MNSCRAVAGFQAKAPSLQRYVIWRVVGKRRFSWEKEQQMDRTSGCLQPLALKRRNARYSTSRSSTMMSSLNFVRPSAGSCASLIQWCAWECLSFSASDFNPRRAEKICVRISGKSRSSFSIRAPRRYWVRELRKWGKKRIQLKLESSAFD